MSYVSKVQIGNNESLLGSNLYGICNTAPQTPNKLVGSSEDEGNKFINTHFTGVPLQGVTVHIKFVQGNSAISNTTLAIGSGTAYPVLGKFVCESNTVISFTFDEQQTWRVNDNIDNDTTYTFSEGTTNGAFSVSVNGGSASSINVHGLGNSAYKGYVDNISNNTTSTDLPTTAAVVNYFSSITGGLTSAMHYKGTSTSAITDGGTQNPTINGTVITTKEAGDVVLYGNQEYVWNGSAWELLGDEGSYILKTSQTTDTVTEVTSLSSVSVGSASGWDAGTQASLSIANNTNTAASLDADDVTIPNVQTAGTAPTFTVSAGVLTITPGTDTVLGTAITATKINEFVANTPASITFTPNTLPTLSLSTESVSRITTSDVTVVVPVSN